MPALFAALVLGLLPAPWTGSARADYPSETVELSLPSGRVATAEYRAGLPGLPAVLVLHGLLQTRDFPTVRRLGEALGDSGYTVLAPTLSLDIDRRTASLACEAIHTHSMESEAEEIHAWLEWLARRTDSPIAAVGHSAGSLQLLAQTALKPHPRVAGLVLISLTYFGPGPSNLEGERHRDRAEADLAAALAGVDLGPQEYALSYCARYPSLPGPYLSYVRWDRTRSLEALRALQDLRIDLVIGGSDRRIDWDWIGELVAAGAHLRRVEGANHFFDAVNELDLLEAVESVLGEIPEQDREGEREAAGAAPERAGGAVEAPPVEPGSGPPLKPSATPGGTPGEAQRGEAGEERP